MAPARHQRIAIVGDGPAASVLATDLARAGRRVAFFSRGARPPLLVGESLVPAIIPFLRHLGVEDEVAKLGLYKPGATFVLNRAGETLQFRFGDVKGRLPGYAYNVPRDRFDAVLRRACERAGAVPIEAAAQVERGEGTDRVALAPASESLAADALGGRPDFIVDASGRSRTLARLLDLPTRAGDRRDTALFAHLEGVRLHEPDHVHTDRLEHGWCWRIPLPGRVSLGVVVPSEVLRPLGATPEERYDAYLSQEPWLKSVTEGASRRTRVMKYDNYQLTTLRGVGDGWALVGDAFGFIDPVFSSGLYLALDGARELARALLRGDPKSFARYERHVIAHVEAWRTIVGYFYDGRLFTLFKVGEQQAENVVGRLLNPHVSKHLPRIFTGEATTKTYSRKLLDFMILFALLDNDPATYQVR
ncbi:MAG: tryptophan 7-halogenase [Proteobacteria bacterium]|nr:tryptophan 7-halogenase [Pseudomonadota bacterium]